jgi:hypothetical protein
VSSKGETQRCLRAGPPSAGVVKKRLFVKVPCEETLMRAFRRVWGRALHVRRAWL